MSARFTVFVSGQCAPAGWLAPLLIKAGDGEANPGPTITAHTSGFAKCVTDKYMVGTILYR